MLSTENFLAVIVKRGITFVKFFVFCFEFWIVLLTVSSTVLTTTTRAWPLGPGLAPTAARTPLPRMPLSSLRPFHKAWTPSSTRSTRSCRSRGSLTGSCRTAWTGCWRSLMPTRSETYTCLWSGRFSADSHYFVGVAVIKPILWCRRMHFSESKEL